MEAHHITPRSLEGTDDYKNLTFIHSYAYKAIHCNKKEIFLKYIKLLEKEVIYHNIDDCKSGKINLKELLINLADKIKYYRIKAENFVLN